MSYAKSQDTTFTDFGAAVALLTQGFKLLAIQRISEKQCTFIFDTRANGDEASTVLDQYWSGALRVSAYDFHQQSKNLKQRLHGARRTYAD